MGPKPYPFTPEQLAWLHDLETTDAPQTRGALHRIVKSDEFPVGYCCMGRAAVTLGLAEAPWSQDEHLGSFHGSSANLMPFYRLHLRSGSGDLLEKVDDWSALTELNDELRWHFTKIAAYCRANPWNVFTDPHAKHDKGCPWNPKTGESCDCGFFKRDFSK